MLNVLTVNSHYQLHNERQRQRKAKTKNESDKMRERYARGKGERGGEMSKSCSESLM